MSEHKNLNRRMFADLGNHIIVSNKGDRRTHFEWLSNQYIGWDMFCKLNMGYHYEDEDTIYIFHTNNYNSIEKINDIINIVKSYLKKIGLNLNKEYTIINGFDADEKPITKFKLNLQDK